MKTFEEVKPDIEALPYLEYIKLTHWLSEHDWQVWDQAIERDSAAGKLDFLIEEAVAEKTGAITPSDLTANAIERDADWAAFETLAGAWSGKFHRDECYDRPILY